MNEFQGHNWYSVAQELHGTIGGDWRKFAYVAWRSFSPDEREPDLLDHFAEDVVRRSVPTLYKWHKAEDFQALVKQAERLLMERYRPAILHNLAKVASGKEDVSAIRLYLEYTGDLGIDGNKVEIDIDVDFNQWQEENQGRQDEAAATLAMYEELTNGKDAEPETG